ncbi:Bifunctional UDP-N-acetylglucosamine transferase and deubiquitinase ALG13 [Oopsacas minuta]|uniref:Bifunctional UDP-N-acetylglucosamine transferase and deubiquitinase ALG13 n=1 Tax=Oopsacas minuta TaxID=111878 RepID=A0AAV7KMA9_9METZ|nr:Bifunctional UDP-N-acetylglucosamine transferase and deubiquitinase ALG13 [Oopsacas minuta]
MSNQYSGSSFQSSILQDDNLLFDQHLKKYSLWRKPLPRDGNSIFRAVAEQLFKSQFLFSILKNNYLQFISTHPVQFQSMTERLTPYHISCSGNDNNKLTLNLSVLSQFYRIKFFIYRESTDIQTISNGILQPLTTLSLARLEDDHFDILYPDSYRDNLAFVQSIFYSILYKNIFQIDLPFSRKNFTLQTIREPYFITQDAYEFSHLERCFNTSYFENISLSLWKSEVSSNSNTISSNIQSLKLSSYSLGDEVRVFSPNTENKPYYVGKILNLNVTPGMHEVLASNRGTEIVDIGHLQPAYEDNDKSQLSSHTNVLTNPERSPIPSLHSSDQVNLFKDSINSKNEFAPSFTPHCDLAQNIVPHTIQSSRSSYISPKDSFTELNSWDIDSKSDQPPGFEDQDIGHGVQKSENANSSNSTNVYKPTHSLTNAHGPKHKYGPQSAVVKQKYQHEQNLTDSTLVMKPFEQIYETAHSQIKKLQFKLNNSSGFLSPKFSIHPEGSDLPEDKFILQYFYNLGVQYQLMRSHGSSWKDVLPNSCPPLYHDSNYHSGNQMVPLMFRDTAGLYFSQDMVVPNYFYDMAMMPFIQGYAPPLTYNLQGEPFLVQNFGKHFKEESDSEKFHPSIKHDAVYGNEENTTRKPNSSIRSRPENESHLTNSGSVDSFDVSPLHLMNYKKPLDDLQSDPSSWPQPGGDKQDIPWINNDLIENQRAAYSNVLKKGTQNRQPTYTAERTIYSSNSGASSVAKNSMPKKNYPGSQNVGPNTYAARKT